MSYLEDQVDFSFWNDDSKFPVTHQGRYIAVSGNTGAGKSTLVKAIRDNLRKTSTNVIGINERVLHHPLLKLMFSLPDEYSFIVQLNFMIQRYAILYRWLSLGYTVVMERSHLDDRLFVEDHVKKNHITLKEYDAYLALAEIFNEKLPEPNIYVYLKAHPTLSISRLTAAERLKERPKEFPDEAVKRSFVEDWYLAFEEHFKNLQQDQEHGRRFKNTKFVSWEAESETEMMASEVVKLLQ